jgi:hypothetical protein
VDVVHGGGETESVVDKNCRYRNRGLRCYSRKRAKQAVKEAGFRKKETRS